jgi:hypothetical protein
MQVNGIAGVASSGGVRSGDSMGLRSRRHCFALPQQGNRTPPENPVNPDGYTIQRCLSTSIGAGHAGIEMG